MWRRVALVWIVLTVLAGGCAQSTGNQQPTTADGFAATGKVDAALDPRGRPYDAAASWWEGNRTESRYVGPFQVAAGELAVMDGNALQADPHFFADEAQLVDFGSVDLVDLSIIWELVTEEESTYEAPLGVRLDVPDTEVDTWQAFEYAYGTDGGVGGITSGFALRPGIAPESAEPFLEMTYETIELYDLDENGVDETLIFSNGYGDGGFPMSRGLDADGALASLLIWHTRYPWRLAVADGTPPPDITKREDELIECIEGRRAVDTYGFCAPDEPTD